MIRDVVPEHIAELNAQPCSQLILSGRNLAQFFMRLGLIDEYVLYVHPIVVGEGQRLFQSPDVTANLTLIGTRTFGNGVVRLHYGRGQD